MKNNILENSISNIDDDLIEMTAQRLMRARPRKTALNIVKTAVKCAGIASAAAALCVAVQLGIKQYNDRSIQSGTFSSSDDSVIMPPSSDDTNSSSSSSNDTSQTPSSSSNTPELSKSEKIEALIHEYGTRDKYPYVAGAKYDGMYVSFGFGEQVHIPISNNGMGPGYNRSHAISLLDDALFLAIASENRESITFLSTTDRAKSWEWSEFNVGNDGKYYYYHMAFRNTKEGILFLKEGDGTGNSSGDYVIFTTEDTGKTWTQAGSLPNVEGITRVMAEGNTYWIAGQNNLLPAILKSDDGVNWREMQISLDTTKYIKGFCMQDLYFSGEMGLTAVSGRTADGNSDAMWYYSEDHGETWSFYKTPLYDTIVNFE